MESSLRFRIAPFLVASLFLATSSDVFGFVPSIPNQRRARSTWNHEGTLSSPLQDQIAADGEPFSFTLDPQSDYAQWLLSDHLGLSEKQRDQVEGYCSLVLEWNQKINLISRKGLTLDVVFGRHVLPCLAPLLLEEDSIQEGQKVVDVGTGGGFPGIPLAICFPQTEFLLVDSVGKKLKAVDDMVDRLGLTNVKTQHARAEQVGPKGEFDWCCGRSVASLPKFCGWMNHLLKPSSGRLLYIIGGDVPEVEIANAEYSIHDLLSSDNEEVDLISEKRLLLFSQEAVGIMAAASEPPTANQKQALSRGSKVPKKKGAAKGAWKPKNNTPRARSDDGFKRYSSA